MVSWAEKGDSIQLSTIFSKGHVYLHCCGHYQGYLHLGFRLHLFLSVLSVQKSVLCIQKILWFGVGSPFSAHKNSTLIIR
jgi:hypothetical protein